jgi:hypothetical protein
MKARTPKQLAKLRWYLEVRKFRRERMAAISQARRKAFSLMLQITVLQMGIAAELDRMRRAQSAVPPPPPETWEERAQ